MSNDAYTHYVVLNETILGEARIIEKCNEWISLAFVKLGVDGPKPFSDCAFVENRALVLSPKPPTRQSHIKSSHEKGHKGRSALRVR